MRKDGQTFILPERAVEMIHQLASDDDLVQLAIGDLSAELIDEYSGAVPHYEIRRAIAKEYGSGPETIRDRERVARLVTRDLRERFPVLRFHQWRAIVSVRDKSKIPELAQWAVEYGDDHSGRAATVLAIRRKLREGGDNPPAWQRRILRVLDLLSSVSNDEEAPYMVRALVQDFADKIKARLQV